VSLYPSEDLLYSPELENLVKEGHVRVPTLPLRFNSFEEYLTRHFDLSLMAETITLQKQLDGIVDNLNPLFSEDTGELIKLRGWSSRAADVKQVQILQIDPPLIGTKSPQRVTLRVEFSLDSIPSGAQQHWRSLKEGDVLYFVSFSKADQNEESIPNGIELVRGCTVVSIQEGGEDLRVEIDPVQYKFDLENIAIAKSKLLEEIYNEF